MPSSKYEKKRKRDLDTDTTALDEDSKGIGDKSDHKHKPERSPSKRFAFIGSIFYYQRRSALKTKKKPGGALGKSKI